LNKATIQAMVNNSGYILALDVGEKRIGIAIASSIARLPAPLTTIINNDDVWSELIKLIAKEKVGMVVVGLPRSLDGKDSAQTVYARKFAQELHKIANIDVVMQDEALTSLQAEAELRARKPNYIKSDIDELAATYILEDYMTTMNNLEIKT
jgi:putative holliday junction resolvase